MKPQLLVVPKTPNQSFGVRHDAVPYFFNKWHFHAEVELVYIIQGTGTHFIGDHVSRFCDGDMFLVGANLPHYWRCDDVYFKGDPDLHAEAKVVHFMQDFWGESFLALPENTAISALLQQARQGILLTGNTREKARPYFDKLLHASGLNRIILLVELLSVIAASKRLSLLSSPAFHSSYNKSDTERLDEVYKYTMSHFTEKICLEDIAAVACLSVNSFCRYFKTQTNKTYSEFLTEIRIGHACRLLAENNKSISAVCRESGFYNFSNFNRFFKQITGKSPLAYRKSLIRG